jgi:hypothetical protein
MTVERKIKLLSATLVPALLTAMTATACSRETNAADTTEAQRAANEAARSAALASGVASDAVDNLVAANDALLLRIDELETRLERQGSAPREADRVPAARSDAYAPARDDNYRTAGKLEPRAPAPVVTYQAPSSRWDVGYQEPGAATDEPVIDYDDRAGYEYQDRSVAADVSPRDDGWRARTVVADPPRPLYRSPDPDRDRPREPTWRRLTVESGTPIAVEIREAISTRYSRPGDTFRARLAGDLLADNGRVAIRDGAAVTGRVVEVRKNQRIGGRASLVVSLDSIELPDGSSAPLEAAWSTRGKSQTPKDAATIGGATVGGAILGRILDKGDGDVIGGLIGAAAGTAVAHQKVGQPIVLGEGAILRMHLRAPIAVRVRS